ncbi:MAG: ABC transporter ATP-binding protein [Planctomycetes bacterium]|nr:ABC transporter ATP-binding protein [Planctomycetota bacterium]
MKMKFLELIRTAKTFTPGGRPPVEVLADVNLEISKGEFVSVIGHSGCGKSTLLTLIAGLELPTDGSVCFREREIERPGPERAVVFQNHSLLPWRTVLQNVLLAVDAVFARESRAQRKARAERWLDKVGLREHMHKYPHEISGGMKQRAGIARALSMEPEVLLLDEPFGALDALTRAQLQDEVLRLHAENNLTVFMVTHDIDEAVYCSDRIVMMNVGPRATIGQILPVPFARPRERLALMESPAFVHCRTECVRFLYAQKRPGTVASITPVTAPMEGVLAPA